MLSNVHNLLQAQGGGGGGGGGGGVVDKVMKFPFSYSNIYLVMNFKMYLWVKSPEAYDES